MNRDDIIRMAREAGAHEHYVNQADEIPWSVEFSLTNLDAFAALVAAAEREECAKVCEEKKEYPMQIPCPDGISGCLVSHYAHARREQTGSECAAAIRARREK